jgi:SAM-dependent methyltransferase
VSALSELERDWDMSWASWATTISEDLQKIPQTEHYSLLIRELQRTGPGGLVLDAGSGLGRLVFLVSQMGYSSFGVDISRKGLAASHRYALENGIRCGFSAGDLRALPIAGDTFNFAHSLGAIEHFPESAPAVQEFYRILRPGGRCFISTPNTWSFHGAIGYKILTLLKNRKLGYIGYEDTYTPKSLARMMESAGFTEVESGLLPSPYLFGVFYAAIPWIGGRLQNLLGRISYMIESRQGIIGFMSYALGRKPEKNI